MDQQRQAFNGAAANIDDCSSSKRQEKHRLRRAKQRVNKLFGKTSENGEDLIQFRSERLGFARVGFQEGAGSQASTRSSCQTSSETCSPASSIQDSMSMSEQGQRSSAFIRTSSRTFGTSHADDDPFARSSLLWKDSLAVGLLQPTKEPFLEATPHSPYKGSDRAAAGVAPIRKVYPMQADLKDHKASFSIDYWDQVVAAAVPYPSSADGNWLSGAVRINTYDMPPGLTRAPYAPAAQECQSRQIDDNTKHELRSLMVNLLPPKPDQGDPSHHNMKRHYTSNSGRTW